jgi:hypothetical protein
MPCHDPYGVCDDSQFIPPTEEMEKARDMAIKLGEMAEIPGFFTNEAQWKSWVFQLKNRYANRNRDYNKETFNAIRTAQMARNGKQGGKSKKLRRGRKVKRGGDKNLKPNCAELQKIVDEAQVEHNNLVNLYSSSVGNSLETRQNVDESSYNLRALKKRLEECQTSTSNTTSGGKARRTRRTNKVKKSGKKARKSSKKSRKAGKKARKTHRRRR